VKNEGGVGKWVGGSLRDRGAALKGHPSAPKSGKNAAGLREKKKRKIAGGLPVCNNRSRRLWEWNSSLVRARRKHGNQENTLVTIRHYKKFRSKTKALFERRGYWE